MPTTQPLPAEIQVKIDSLLAAIAQYDSELARLQVAVGNWLAQQKVLQDEVASLKKKYGKPTLGVWPAEVVTP